MGLVEINLYVDFLLGSVCITHGLVIDFGIYTCAILNHILQIWIELRLRSYCRCLIHKWDFRKHESYKWSRAMMWWTVVSKLYIYSFFISWHILYWFRIILFCISFVVTKYFLFISCAFFLHLFCISYAFLMHFSCISYALLMHFLCTSYALLMHFIKVH